MTKKCQNRKILKNEIERKWRSCNKYLKWIKEYLRLIKVGKERIHECNEENECEADGELEPKGRNC